MVLSFCDEYNNGIWYDDESIIYDKLLWSLLHEHHICNDPIKNNNPYQMDWIFIIMIHNRLSLTMIVKELCYHYVSFIVLSVVVDDDDDDIYLILLIDMACLWDNNDNSYLLLTILIMNHNLYGTNLIHSSLRHADIVREVMNSGVTYCYHYRLRREVGDDNIISAIPTITASAPL